MRVKRSKKGVKKVKQHNISLFRRFLATSGDKMLTLFEELKGSDASPELVQVRLVLFCVFFSPYFVDRICPVYARRTSLPQIALPSVNFNFKDKDKKYLFERTECFHGFEDALLSLRIDKWILIQKVLGECSLRFVPPRVSKMRCPL